MSVSIERHVSRLGLLATLLFPYMPATSRTIFSQLNTVPRKINPEYV